MLEMLEASACLQAEVEVHLQVQKDAFPVQVPLK